MWNARPFRRGERVHANFQGQGRWVGAVVVGVHQDTATYDLQYDQGLCEHVGRNQAGRKQVGARSEPGAA